jgi:hypothetical protein
MKTAVMCRHLSRNGNSLFTDASNTLQTTKHLRSAFVNTDRPTCSLHLCVLRSIIQHTHAQLDSIHVMANYLFLDVVRPQSPEKFNIAVASGLYCLCFHKYRLALPLPQFLFTELKSSVSSARSCCLQRFIEKCLGPFCITKKVME